MAADLSKKHMEWCHRMACDTLDLLGYGFWSKYLTIKFQKGGKGLKRTFANASFTNGITININPWKRLGYYQRLELIDHEVCHIVTQLADKEYDDPHRGHWAALMRKLGYAPREFLPWRFAE
jgi:hypothetical protein